MTDNKEMHSQNQSLKQEVIQEVNNNYSLHGLGPISHTHSRHLHVEDAWIFTFVHLPGRGAWG